MRRRARLLTACLVAWLAGSTLGALAPAPWMRAGAAPLLQIGRAHASAEALPSISGDRPIFILTLGSDARRGEEVDRARSDSIHLVGINTRRERATIVGIPRDSWVSIPGVGTGKINGAMTYGGPELAVATVEQLTGIRIDYYALTSFPGLRRMIDQIGGLTIEVPYPMNDPFSGANLEAGVQRLRGAEVLAFSRNRHDTPAGDFSRSQNQGRVFLASLAQFRKQLGEDPARLFTWIAAGARNVQTDLSIRELVTLAFTAYRVKPGGVRNLVLPGSVGMQAGQSVVLIGPEATEIFRDMADDGLVSKRTYTPPEEP